MNNSIPSLLLHIIGKLLSSELDSHALRVYLDFNAEQRKAYQHLKSQNPEGSVNLYQDDPEGLFSNIRELMYYQIAPAELVNLLKFNNDWKESIKSCEGTDVDLYHDDPERLFANVRELMYYRIKPDELVILLNFYKYWKETPSESSNGINVLEDFFKDIIKLKQSDLNIADLLEQSDSQHKYYAQEGEDIILSRLFKDKAEGFYVDIGAHHPKKYSNTYYFYRRGWRGINVEPDSDVKELFDKYRPEDSNICVAVTNSESRHEFYVFHEKALNTLSKELADEYIGMGHKLVEVRNVQAYRLSQILNENAAQKTIDFMSIDVEDFELQVLESNDWNIYRPTILLIEILDFDINNPEKYPVHNYVVEKGYVMISKLFNTVIYQDARVDESVRGAIN